MVYKIKSGFDAEFEALHRQKMQEVVNVKERNKDIQRIMAKLDMKRELWEPSLTDSEQPERLFIVDDSEVNNPSSNMEKNIWQSSLSKPNPELCPFCLVVDKSREVPHPRAERGAREEEVGSTKTFGCPSMPPQLMCPCFQLWSLNILQKHLKERICFTHSVNLLAIYQFCIFYRLELVIITFLSVFFCQTVNLRELAINEMMGGSLDVKQEDILEKV